MGSLVEEYGIYRESLGEERGIAIGEERGIAIGEERGIAIGEERGIAIGEERGVAIGEERGYERGQADCIRNLAHSLTQEEIAGLTQLPLEKIRGFLSSDGVR